MKKYIILFFFSSFISHSTFLFSIKRGHVWRTRHGGREYVEPRSSVRIGFSVHGSNDCFDSSYVGSRWHNRDPWGRYRAYPRGWFGWWPAQEGRIIIVGEHQDNIDEESDGDISFDGGYDFEEYTVDDLSVIHMQIQSIDSDLFTKKGKKYYSLAAYAGAKILLFLPLLSLKSDRKRVIASADHMGLFEKSYYQRLLKRALKELKQRQSKQEAFRSDFTAESLRLIPWDEGLISIGYEGVVASDDSFKGALKTVIKNLKDGVQETWVLPVYQNTEEWVAFSVRREGNTVFVVSIVYE